MTDLEILQNLVDCLIKNYIYENYNNPKFITYDEKQMQEMAIEYCSNIIGKLVKGAYVCDNEFFCDYNLKNDIQVLNSDSIKNELLKNVVNVASWHRINDTSAGNRLGIRLSYELSDDEISVVLCNIIEQNGVEVVNNLLNDSDILLSVCRTFSWYRKSKDYSKIKGYLNEDGEKNVVFYGESFMRKDLDIISIAYGKSIRLNEQLDSYYLKNNKKSWSFDCSEYVPVYTYKK